MGLYLVTDPDGTILMNEDPSGHGTPYMPQLDDPAFLYVGTYTHYGRGCPPPNPEERVRKAYELVERFAAIYSGHGLVFATVDEDFELGVVVPRQVAIDLTAIVQALQAMDAAVGSTAEGVSASNVHWWGIAEQSMDLCDCRVVGNADEAVKLWQSSYSDS